MPIAFEGVSYSYTAPSKKRRTRRGVTGAPGAPGHAAVPEAPTVPATGRPPGALWGNAPQAACALTGITFTLADGEFLGIAGHTGSGKSTLIQHMNGLLHPTSGRVLVDGTDIADKKAAAQARSEVGLVFQYPEHQLFAATVYDDVAFGPRNKGLGADEVDACVRTSLGQVDLDFDEVRDKSPFELSGGQQRRVAFAGVLAMRPGRLILDEPVAGLDPCARNDFLDLIAGLHAQGMSVVMVSHTMDDLARLCDRILVLKQGALFALGTPEEVFSRAGELHGIGLGVPCAQRLANSLKARGIALEDALYDSASLAQALAGIYRAAARQDKNHA